MKFRDSGVGLPEAGFRFRLSGLGFPGAQTATPGVNHKVKARPKKPMSLARMTAVGVACLLIFIGQMLFYTWCRVQCVAIGYEISAETERNRELTTLQNNLKIELARLKSPERIEKIARNYLGLAAPNADQVIILE